MTYADLPNIRSAVKETLTGILPATWHIEPTLEAPTKRLVTAVYLEFTGITAHTANGDELGPDELGANFNLVIQSTSTDTAKAEAEIDAAILPVIRALDAQDDLWWSNAEKGRMQDGGLLYWRITGGAIATTTDPTPTEE